MAQSRRPFGRSADLGERANAVRTATVTFPLTPALSLGERGNPPLPFSTTQRGVRPTNLPKNPSCSRLLVGKGVALPPLPPRCRDRVHSLYLPACRFPTPGDPRWRRLSRVGSSDFGQSEPPRGSSSAVL